MDTDDALTELPAGGAFEREGLQDFKVLAALYEGRGRENGKTRDGRDVAELFCKVDYICGIAFEREDDGIGGIGGESFGF
jgi:hypothetical protein